MAYCCSQCKFTAQFESGLMMHRQLHHDSDVDDFPDLTMPNAMTEKEKSNTVPRVTTLDSSYTNADKGFKLPGRTSSATRLFDKLRARICRSKTLFSHPEENIDRPLNNDMSILSECTSKALKVDSLSITSAGTAGLRDDQKETFGCHLCNFDADRITVLDRHLLNDHKIGLENLLKLVMAKTKDGLSEESATAMYSLRQPYYKPLDEIIQDGEFIIETVTPKIKILKHASTNTEIQWSDIPDLKNNCRMITKELEKLFSPAETCDKDDFLTKMQTLNECMCKFVDSSNTLKKVLTKEFDTKNSAREHLNGDEPFLKLGLGDRDTPREWNRAHSEKMERNRSKHGEKRDDKTKFSSESFYF